MSTAPASLTGQVVLVGYGKIGQNIATDLRKHNIAFVVAEQNRAAVESLRAEGISAVSGDATTPEVLIQAHITRAALLVITVFDTIDVRKMIEIARTLNPSIGVILTTHNEEEAELLEADRLGKVFLSDRELAKSMAQYVMNQFGIDGQETSGRNNDQ